MDRAGADLPTRSTLRALFRVPLFYKLVLANTAILIVAVGTTTALAPGRIGRGGLDSPGFAVALGLLLLVSAALNGALVAVALAPLRSLEDTARRVQEGDLSARASRSPLADRSLAGLTALFNHMLDSLEALRVRQRELTIRALEAEERERERISRLLLDRTAQSLATLLLRLRVAGGARSVSTQDRLGPLRDAMTHALEDVRRVARELRPPELSDVGFRAALDAHARTVGQSTGMSVRVEGRIDEARMSWQVRSGLFRILQEAVRNAVRHSGASGVRIRLDEGPDWVRAEVSDDGVGFDATAIREQGGDRLGLFELCERAALLDGSATIESAPGNGTSVRVELPLRDAATRPVRHDSA